MTQRSSHLLRILGVNPLRPHCDYRFTHRDLEVQKGLGICDPCDALSSIFTPHLKASGRKKVLSK